MLTEATKSFLFHCQFEKNLSSKTLKAYETDLRQFIGFLKTRSYSADVRSITKKELREYLEIIAPLKPKSIKRKVATLKAMFNYLEFDDKITLNPFRKMRIRIKEPKSLPKALSIQEMGAIFKVAYANYINNKNKTWHSCFEALRNVAVIELLFATGGRVSEIADLKDIHINIVSGSVTIKGKGNKERVVHICNKETLALLKEYRKHRTAKTGNDTPYFLINRTNNKLSDQSIRSIVKKLSDQAKIKNHITPHVFRHSFATLLLEKDVDIKYIQSMLGHSSIMTTQIYTHVNREKQRQILKSKHPRKDFSQMITDYPE